MTPAIDTTVASLMNAAHQIAPEAWRMAVQQQVREACIALFFQVLGALLFAWSSVWIVRKARLYKGSDEGTDFILYIFAGASGIISAALFYSSLRTVLIIQTPEYYTALNLLKAVQP